MTKDNSIKITKVDGNWQIGTIDGIPFNAKVYDEPSEFGIRNGNVSKLWVKDIMNYDRGWDERPKTAESKALLKRLLAYFKPQA